MTHPKKKRIINKLLLSEIASRPCLICGKTPSDACHIKSKGSGGDDTEDNLLSLCRRHHAEQHNKGFFKMAHKYPVILWVLHNKGWEFIDSGPYPRLVRK